MHFKLPSFLEIKKHTLKLDTEQTLKNIKLKIKKIK